MTIPDKNTVHIWIIKTDSNPEILNGSSEILSVRESDRLDGYNFERDKVKFAFRHIKLREILAQYIDCEPQEIVFNYNNYKKPHISYPVTGLNIKFNISYSNKIILLGITTEDEIGVDVEQIVELNNLDDLAKDHFSSEEYSYYIKFNKMEKLNIFYKIWCAKESYIKAVGMGFYYPLDSFYVRFNDQNQFDSIILRQCPEAKIYWATKEISINDDYFGCFTHKKKNLKLKIFS